MNAITSWGRLERPPHQIVTLYELEQIKSITAANAQPGIAYGMGRSYGDVCLNPSGPLWLTRHLDHLIAFDDETGLLVCEAGILLRDIQQIFLPRGWLLAVSPGTQMITVGGAIANDVHGKNHHVRGCFAHHVRGIKLARTDGALIECSSSQAPEWFAATVGGAGLTGIILEATIQLQRVQGPWLESEIIPYGDVNEFFYLAKSSELDWEHTVSWFDSRKAQGRGLFLRAKVAEDQSLSPFKKRTPAQPWLPPCSLVNHYTVPIINTLYYHLKKRQNSLARCHYESFLYPLDNLLEWNRLYGAKGFYQYQCVLPDHNAVEGMALLLQEIARSNIGSFLNVLKTFGPHQSLGLLSFAQPGATLAIDFPNQQSKTLHVLQRLDAIVRELGGRLYLAKDARMSAEFFAATYPNLPEFLKYRDPGISSGLSRRLMGY